MLSTIVSLFRGTATKRTINPSSLDNTEPTGAKLWRNIQSLGQGLTIFPSTRGNKKVLTSYFRNAIEGTHVIIVSNRPWIIYPRERTQSSSDRKIDFAISTPKKQAAFAGNARSMTGAVPLYRAPTPSSFTNVLRRAKGVI